MAELLDNPERVRRALAHPTIGPQLSTLGVKFYPAFGGGFAYCPPAQREHVAELIELAHRAAPTEATEPRAVEPDLSGRPLPALATAEAIKLYGEGATAYRVDQETALSYRGALRVETWVESGAVWWDATEGRIRAARGFRLLKSGSEKEPALRLARA
jgi:hypothetical protein